MGSISKEGTRGVGSYRNGWTTCALLIQSFPSLSLATNSSSLHSIPLHSNSTLYNLCHLFLAQPLSRAISARVPMHVLIYKYMVTRATFLNFFRPTNSTLVHIKVEVGNLARISLTHFSLYKRATILTLG